MGFFDELTNLFTQEEIDKSFKLEVLGRTAVCVTGYKKIISLGESCVVLLLKGMTKLSVAGAKLYIKKLEENEVVIAGTIMNISLE